MITAQRAWSVLGFSGWCAIIILSLVPGSARPHTGVSGGGEHFFAYAMVAFALSLGEPRLTKRLKLLAALGGLSIALELAQIYIPGRTAEVVGFVSAGAGVAVGASLAWLINRA